MAVDPKGAKLVLVAPAWKKYYPAKKIESAIVLHSETDDIVAFEDTQELFRSSVGVTVIACDDNHRMRKKETLEKIIECVKSFAAE